MRPSTTFVPCRRRRHRSATCVKASIDQSQPMILRGVFFAPFCNPLALARIHALARMRIGPAASIAAIRRRFDFMNFHRLGGKDSWRLLVGRDCGLILTADLAAARNHVCPWHNRPCLRRISCLCSLQSYFSTTVGSVVSADGAFWIMAWPALLIITQTVATMSVHENFMKFSSGCGWGTRRGW
jgi:hypothetical protein